MGLKVKFPIFLFLVFLAYIQCYAQKNTNFGTLTKAEKAFAVYEPDTTAAAVYLYEKGDNYFEVRNDFVWLITEYHAKIKILKKEGLSKSEISIPYYHNDSRTEKVQKIKALSHNGIVKTAVNSSDIYVIDNNENWSEKKFAIPNVKVGSVLEYTYEIQSPFFFNLNGWDFQSDIPKVYTEYTAKIPGNWRYNRRLSGKLQLDTNEADIKADCFTIPTATKQADCEVVKYAMRNVPSFAEDEEYMLAGSNYRSKLEFELQEYHDFKGQKHRYTKTWKDVDKEFRLDKDIGRQLRKKNFFEKNVPADLFIESNELEKAKNIYAFVQKHYNWNGKYGLWKDNRVKRAFEEGKGNVAEINISLINLLNAAGIKADLVLTATRNRGLPKTKNPVMSGFNYILVKINIDGKDYLLDASNKYVPFGMLPFRSLNYYGRVMDFDEESYWFDIVPEKNNKKQVRCLMVLDAENGIIKGKLSLLSSGYYAINGWQNLKLQSEEAYLDEMQENFEEEYDIIDYDIKEDRSNEKFLAEEFEFESDIEDNTLYLDPFIINFFEKNPFKALERNYPIDFGYTRNNGYTITIQLPKNYKVKSLPEDKVFQLPDNVGSLKFNCKETANNSLNVFFDFKLNATQYKSEYYKAIKELFQEAVDVQTKSIIVLEKA